jgi:signal transduction histidine kinase
VLSNDHTLLGRVGTIEDITDIRAIEEMKRQFISLVSHELRTPLASIRGSLGLLSEGVLEDDPSATQHMLKIAAAESDRLVRLVNDILTLERLESHQTVLDKKWHDSQTLMQQAVNTLQQIAQENGVELSITPGELQVWGDADRIIQTLINLVSNAIKFSLPEGTVSLKAELQEGNELSCSPPSMLFSVKDQGRGIPADKLESIFRRFQQVDASDSRDKGGTGLGLAICQQIIEQHGGKIWAESRLGQGSTFHFTLPFPKDTN